MDKSRHAADFSIEERPPAFVAMILWAGYGSSSPVGCHPRAVMDTFVWLAIWWDRRHRDRGESSGVSSEILNDEINADFELVQEQFHALEL